MITIEKSPCIALQYKWTLAKRKKDVVYLSNKIKYRENDSFRLGFKDMSKESHPTLLFVTTNLNKIGLEATAVTFSCRTRSKIEEMELNTSSDDKMMTE